MEVDGQIYSREVKIVDLIGEHLRRKEKTKMGEGWEEWGVERKKKRKSEQIC
jgi:hypothetical protein